MNANTAAKYGRLRTWTTPIHRVCGCPFCDFTARTTRRGPRGNALGATARIQGEVMAHMRASHADELAAELGKG